MRLDGLALALMRTEDQLSAYPTHQIFSMTYHTTTLSIPQCFATISEARLYLEDITWRIAPNHSSSRSTSCHASPPPTYDISPVTRTTTTRGHFSSTLDCDSIRATIREWYLASAAQKSASSRVQFARWHTAFAPLLEHAMTATGASSFVPAATLYVQALVDKLALAEQLVVPEHAERELEREDERMQTILTILSLSRRLVAHPAFSRGFVFDNGIIWPLVQILVVCSDRNLRWEAYEVLRSMIPRREGVWDSKSVVEAAEKMLAQDDGRACNATKVAHKMIDPRLEMNEVNALMMDEMMMDFKYGSSDFEDTASDRDSIDPRLLQNDSPPAMMMEEFIDPLLRMESSGPTTTRCF